MASGPQNNRVAVPVVAHHGDTSPSSGQPPSRVRVESSTTTTAAPEATAHGAHDTSLPHSRLQQLELQPLESLVDDEPSDRDLDATDSDNSTLENTIDDASSSAETLHEASLSDKKHADTEVVGKLTADERSEIADDESIELASYSDAVMQMQADGDFKLNSSNIQILARLQDPRPVSGRLVQGEDNPVDSSQTARGRSKPDSLPDEMPDHAMTPGHAIRAPSNDSFLLGMGQWE